MSLPLPPRTVVVVASDAADQRFLADVYSRSGWRTFPASSIADGTALLRRLSPDLIVCDHALPDGSWRDILAIAGLGAADCPVVVASPFADEHMWAEVLNLGGFDVLAKPFDSREALWMSACACRIASASLGRLDQAAAVA